MRARQTGTAFQNPSARSYTIPAPVGGIYAKGPEQLTDEFYARDLVNVVPGQDLDIRRGYTAHSTGMTTDVETLAVHAKPDGTRVLLAAANGNIYNASSAGAATDLTTSFAGFGSNRWQFTSCHGNTIFANGVDEPVVFDGTSFSTGVISGSGLTPDNLITATVYKSRIYMIEANTTTFWYCSNLGSYGTLTDVDMYDQLNKSGHLLYAGGWTRDTGSGLEDVFLLLSSEGELLMYTGSYPAADSWENVGRYYLPRPIGEYRSVFNIPGDVGIITEGGIFLVSALVAANDVGAQISAYTENIKPLFKEDVHSYGSNIGWSGFYYGAQGWTLVNVPVASNSKSKQWVVKLVTNPATNSLVNSWFRFDGWHAYCFAEYNGELFFGSDDGNVYKADYGYNDNDGAIDISIDHTFSYLGDRTHRKQVVAARSLMRASSNIELGYGVDMDFRDDGEVNSISNIVDAITPWGSPWGSSWGGVGPNTPIQNWEMIAADLGYAAALKVKAQLKDINFQFSATNIQYTPGGNF